MKLFRITLSTIILSTVVTGCTYDIAIECHIEEVSYSNDITPLLDAKCGSCHSGFSPEGNLDLTTYNSASDAVLVGDVLSRITLPLSSDLVMPPTGGLSECDIEKITRWLNDGAPNN